MRRGPAAAGAALTLALSLGLVAAAAAQERVRVPGAAPGPDLPGYWFTTAQPGRRPAAVLLHGCGGPYRANQVGELSRRMREVAALLQGQGWHALVVDSLTPRGERELCTQKLGSRRVTMTERRIDALAALAWLAARADVDGARLLLVGWSNGGSTVLAATDARHWRVREAAVKPAAAIAFYPGCEAALGRDYEPLAPLLMLLGAADDWTPAAPCLELAARWPARIRAVAYDGAYHGFDGTAALRVRRDVPNGVRKGGGVTVGGQPAAREASRRELLAFLHRVAGGAP